MTELYEDISDELRSIAQTAWDIAFAQKTPMEAAEFLNTVTNYYNNTLTEEEVEFLQFYFQLRMEMMKNE